jgi:hypothetical protein
MPKKIKVHEKALAHLSRGLYRSPASAIRELVSNAWDANATVIHIDTNYPNFLQLTIQDNGEGFTRQEFDNLMSGGIGNSEKRVKSKSLIHNRPIIGRLGIGMLGIAQLTGSFTIISKKEDNTGFKAKVSLYDLLKEKLDNEDKTVVTQAKDEKHDTYKEIDLGTYEFEDFDPDSVKRGTTIVAEDIHPAFARSFQQSLTYDKFKPVPLDWMDCLKIVSQVHSLQELGDYWRFLWELSASCPIPYLSANALPDKLTKEEQQKLLSYNFNLIVDSRKLYKPIYLKGNPGGYTSQKIKHEQMKVYGRDLKFHGYIVVQEGAQLHPDELRGILIRIKNVAIGYYDPSMLDYRTNEGPRSRWLTSEIFVDEGLEDALNIDRDSFNRVHPEFRAIQEYVHESLKSVFSNVWKNIDVRSEQRTKAKEKARKEHLSSVISQVVESRLALKTSVSVEGHEPKAVIKKEKHQIEVNLPSPDSLKTKKANKQLAASILALFEVAMREKTAEKRKEIFTNLLLDLLAGW